MRRSLQVLSRLHAFHALLLLGGASGCGGSEEPTKPIVPEYEALTVTSWGPFDESPAGAACDLAKGARHTFTKATRKLSWDSCSASAQGPTLRPEEVMHDAGSRVIDEAEAALVQDSVDSLAPGDLLSCGADGPPVVLDVVAEGRTQRFADDFYAACPWGVLEGRTYVEGVPALEHTLFQLERLGD